MIAENCADLFARVVTVSALTNSTGYALGGKTQDPTLTLVPLPAAWIMFAHDLVNEPTEGRVPSIEVVEAMYAVVIYIPYISQADLLATQYPMLEAVIQAVRGGQAPSGHRWRYVGQKLALVYPDRMAYEQHYTLIMAL